VLSKPDQNTENEMTFLEHLEELRWTIIRSFIAIGVVFFAAFAFKQFVFDRFVLAPLKPSFWTYGFMCRLSKSVGLGDGLCIETVSFQLQSIQMSGQFMTHIIVSFVAGIIVAFPYILWELWRFIKPGLHPREQKSLRWVVLSGSLLFMAGILFGYYLLAPLSIQFLGGYQVSESVSNNISLNSFISTVTSVTMATGILFQLPLVVLFMTRAGLVTPAFLRAYRRHAVVIILVLSAVITPPDVTSQILVTLPLMLLYEASIILSARTIKRMAKLS
jgi:sec-independent protein translocase protein TatC